MRPLAGGVDFDEGIAQETNLYLAWSRNSLRLLIECVRTETLLWGSSSTLSVSGVMCSGIFATISPTVFTARIWNQREMDTQMLPFSDHLGKLS